VAQLVEHPQPKPADRLGSAFTTNVAAWLTGQASGDGYRRPLMTEVQQASINEIELN